LSNRLVVAGLAWTLCVLAGCGETGLVDEAASLDGAAGPVRDAGQGLDGGFQSSYDAGYPADAERSDAQPPSSGADGSTALDAAADAASDAALAADAGSDGAPASDAASDAAPASDAASDASADAGTGAVKMPSQLPTKGGTCPAFVSGDANFSPAGVTTRKVRLWVGASGGGPLVLYWHSTGAQPSEAETAGLKNVLAQITAAGGVVAAPYTGANEGTFPWLSTTSEALKVADEVVACAIEKKNIDARRIHVIGFSAGGLMTSTMSLQRSAYVASVAPYSGGLQGSATFQDASNKFAALILHGGSSDSFVINFQSTSTSYSTALRANGNPSILCNHGGGHSIPSAGPAAAWRFFQDHPFGTAPSPYATSGLPAGFPNCQLQP
jgi:dienelactone hydrolase